LTTTNTALLQWDYANRRCRISMPGYIENLLIKFKHPRPVKPRLSPYKCLPITYGVKAQLTPEADTSELLDETGNAVSKKSSARSSTMPERLTTNYW
jgi:hypothetical protein